MTLRRFSPGESIVLRQLWQGRIWAVRSAVVVQDTQDLIVSWCPAGRREKVPRAPNGDRARPGHWPNGGWILEDISPENSYLRLSVPGQEYSVLIFQYAAQIRQWYINLERPLQRRAIGFDYEDRVLDVIVAPDLRSWHWDDEDELEEAVESGLITKKESADLYTLGKNVVSQLQSGKSIFNGWEKWRPGPSQRIPELRERCDTL